MPSLSSTVWLWILLVAISLSSNKSLTAVEVLTPGFRPPAVPVGTQTRTRSDRKYRYRKERAARSFMRQRNHSYCVRVRQCARLRSASRRLNTALCVGNLYMPTSQINSDVDCDPDVEKLCIAHQISSVHIFWCDMHI